MSSFNKVYIVGNLAQDPEMRDITKTRKVTDFVVAVNRDWVGDEGEKGSEVSYIDCSAFGKKAEVIEKYFKKGRKILVEGRLKQEKWVDKETKKNRSKLSVVVENFHFMDSKKVDDTLEAIPASAGNEENSDSDFDMDSL
jgi:single-strand DNA-binding protein